MNRLLLQAEVPNNLIQFLENGMDSCDQACVGSVPVPDWVEGEMGLARPDLAQAWARSALDLFILVQMKSSNFSFDPEEKDTGCFYSGAASMEVLPE